MPGNLFEGNPVDEGTTRRGTDTPVHRPDVNFLKTTFTLKLCCVVTFIVLMSVPSDVQKMIRDSLVRLWLHLMEKTEGSTHSSTNGLLSCEQLERQVEFHSSTQDEA